MGDVKIGKPSVPAEVEAGQGRAMAQRRLLLALIAVIAVLLVTHALRMTYSVTMPLALAFFLSATVYPVHAAIVRRVPVWLRGLGLLASLILVMLALGVLVGAIWLMGELVAPRMPEYGDRLQQYWQSIQDWARQIGLPLPAPMEGGDGEEGGGDLLGSLSSTLPAFASSILSFLLLLVLTLFFMLLMLGDVALWREKANNALAGDLGERVIDAVRTIARKVRVFLLVRTFVSVISGLAAGLWLWLVGVDLALVWGLLFFVLNYIPNIGSIIAGLPPILIALMQFGPVWAVVAAAGLILIEQVIGNYLDPKLQGRNLDVSPLIVLVSVIFWGWVWGFVGALLAVPMTVTILIVCARIEALRPLAMLLSSSTSFEQLDEGTR